MKRILFLALTVLLAVGCYDDAALWDQIRDYEERIVSLEKLCNQMNTNISSLQTIVAALQDKDYVTNVAPIAENGKEIGYTITFSKSGSITIYHGNDGENGKDGVDGKDGSTPVIGVKMASDGVYYWTIDGEWLLDSDGNKIPTTGKDGADGQNGENGQDGADGITPQLKIEEDYWYISYDNGQTWDKQGKAVGEDGKDGADGADGENGDSFFKSVTQDEENVYITLADGTEFVLPKAKQSNVTIWLKPLKDGSATFFGNVLNTSVDLKVTIYYSIYKDLTIYKYDDKVSVTDFPNNTFSLVLEGLDPDTQYYYFTEVVYNGTIEYSDIDTFVVPAFSDWEGVYFYDDFDWMAPWVDAYGSGDSVGENNPSAKAANVYTQKSHMEYDGIGYANGGSGVAGCPSFLTEFADRGYEDVNVDGRSLYTQKYYLKFGKTGVPTGIKLPAMEIEGTDATDVVLSFDWSAQMTVAGVVDNVKIVVEIDGEGVCADSQTKISNPIYPDQETGELKWQNVKLLLKGINNATRITIRPAVLDDSDGVKQKRWYIDNIKIVRFEGEVPTPPAPKPEMLFAEWLFSADAMPTYASTFTGATKEAGDGGQYINANVAGNGRISYVQIDKTALDTEGRAARYVGSTGHPYVSGVWPGDYWLFEATDGYAYPAGTSVNISYITRTSRTGHKYWRLEYIDGTEWKAAMPTTKYTLNGEDIEYNIDMNEDGKTNVAVNTTVTLSAPTKDIKFRMVCAGNGQSSDEAALAAPNGGTCRIAGDDTGTSPVIKVIE